MYALSRYTSNNLHRPYTFRERVQYEFRERMRGEWRHSLWDALEMGHHLSRILWPAIPWTIPLPIEMIRMDKNVLSRHIFAKSIRGATKEDAVLLAAVSRTAHETQGRRAVSRTCRKRAS